jgi:ribulose-bisphosphate carboxylase large chain
MSTTHQLQFSGSRFLVDYHLSGTEAEARAKAALVCIDQTVEAPIDIVQAGHEQILGRLERLIPAEAGYDATISYPVELVGGSCAQLLNVLFGISSLRQGIRVLRFDPPPSVLEPWPGPRFGREGLRKLAGVAGRPLVCGVLKPLGSSVSVLAELAYQFALGGLDLIKDDQSLADHAFCSFDERVARCAEAVAGANRETGRTCLYFPHVGWSGSGLRSRCLAAKQAGAGGLLIAPGLTGFDALRETAADDAIALPILSHPALLGSFIVHADSGMSPSVVFGQLPRLAGADASLYPIYNAGFPMTGNDCRDVARAAGAPWGGLKPIFPTAAGRIGVERVKELCAFHGNDVLFILGSSIQRQEAGLVAACRAFMDEVTRCAGG